MVQAGDEVSVEPCTTHDLIDQPTRWLNAAQDVVADPDLLPTVLDRLLGPHPSAWTATEHARAGAFMALAQQATPATAPGNATVEFDETGSGVLARIGGHVVGAAAFGVVALHELTIEVAPAWRRLGIGSGLLTRAAARATADGLDELSLLAPADDEGFVPMVCSAGLRARIKVSDGLLQARITLAAARV